MRKKKWLFIIVGILLIINLLFLILIRYAKVDKTVQRKLEDYLTRKLQAKVSIENFSFNDKQININGFSIRDPENTYHLEVKQIYIEYNLGRLLFSSFSGLKSIKNIKIYQPYLFLSLDHIASQSDQKRKLPDFSRLFRSMNVFDGRIDLIYRSNSLQAEQRFRNVRIDINNSVYSEISAQALTPDSADFALGMILRAGQLRELTLETRDFRPARLQVEKLEKIDFLVDLILDYRHRKLTYTGKIKDLQLHGFSSFAVCDSVNFEGNQDSLRIRVQDMNIANSVTKGWLLISNLKRERTLQGYFQSADITLDNYLHGVQGKLQAETRITGSWLKPDIHMLVSGDTLSYHRQVISNLETYLAYSGNTLTAELRQAYWKENRIQGAGSYSIQDGLNYELYIPDFYVRYDWGYMQGNLYINGKYPEDNFLDFSFQNLEVRYHDAVFYDLTWEGDLSRERFSCKLQNNNRNFVLTAAGDIDLKKLSGNLKLKRFDPNPHFTGNLLPLISGNTKFNMNSQNIRVNSSLIVFDQDFGRLNGRIEAELEADLQSGLLVASLRTRNLKFNYEPVDLTFSCYGKTDSLNISYLNINDEIYASGWLDPTDLQHFKLDLKAANLDLQNYLRYFAESATASDIAGKCNIDLHYNSREDRQVAGNIEIKNFSYKDLTDIRGNMLIRAEGDQIETDNFSLFRADRKLFSLTGNLNLFPQFAMSISGEMNDLELAELFPETGTSGLLNVFFKYLHDGRESELALSLTLHQSIINNMAIGDIEAEFVQKDSLLLIKKLIAERKNSYTLSGNGTIGYNLIRNRLYPDTSQVTLKFSGDLLALILAKNNHVEEIRSDSDIELIMKAGEEGLSVTRGQVNLRRGRLKIKNQPTPVDKIDIQLSILNDILTLDKFTLRMGEGRFRVYNRIYNDGKDLVYGMIRIGRIYINTTQDGVLFHLPRYMPGKGVAVTRITGRESDYLEISGPFDEVFIIGDIHFSNGAAIYPPDTENILKLLQRLSTQKKKSETSSDLPLEFDLRLYFDENIRYVTYPLNLTVNEDSYLYLEYVNGKYVVPEARFVAEKGTIDIFGTRLQAEYVHVFYNQYSSSADIQAVFSRRAADGTLITLEVISLGDEEGGSPGAFDFRLSSDNPGDSRLDILALLRYGRRVDEISGPQKKILLQDEVIQIAGFSIESAVVDPLISPVENWIRQALNLDFFHLQTNLIQNIFSRYSSDETDYYLDEEGKKQANSTSELFLNNLSVGMGKYISRKLFLDYQARFEKPQELALTSSMGIYHDIALRYELPLKFRIVYKFRILPFDEENSHEISLEKSFRF